MYWSNGAQICSPHDREVLRCVEEQLEPWSSSCWDEGLVETSSLRTDPLTQINRCYMEELSCLCFHRLGLEPCVDIPTPLTWLFCLSGI